MRTDPSKRPSYNRTVDRVSGILVTGIKVGDLLAPSAQGREDRLFGGAGSARTVLSRKLINNVAQGRMGGYSVFAGRRGRGGTREGNDMVSNGIHRNQGQRHPSSDSQRSNRNALCVRAKRTSPARARAPAVGLRVNRRRVV